LLASGALPWSESSEKPSAEPASAERLAPASR
jgi:hypothetical protein